MSIDLHGPVQRLFPQPGKPEPLQGRYLELELPAGGRFGPYVYANFVTSLDGRISLRDPRSGRESVPSSLADPRDWRLFQELAAHADVLLTSGRYLRDLEAGAAQDMLPLSLAPAFADLHRWRRQHRSTPQPDVAVLSASLAFRIPESLRAQGRRIMVLTTNGAPAAEAARLQREQVSVHRLGDGPRICGRAAIQALAALGYHRVYSVTGPWVFHSLVQAGAVDALFLTLRQRLLGGEGFSTIVAGPLLQPPADFRLRWIYRDLAPQSAEQLYLHLVRD